MQRITRVIIVAGLAAAASLSWGASAGAGDFAQARVLNIDVRVFGSESANISTSWIPEVFVGSLDDYAPGGTLNCAEDASYDYQSYEAGRLHACHTAVSGDIDVTLGFPETPPGYVVDAYCFTEAILFEAFDGSNGTSFTVNIDQQSPTTCVITMTTNVVAFDKVLSSEADFADLVEVGDFTLELWGGGDPIETTDPNAATCQFGTIVDSTLCAVVDVPAGDYTLGETGLPGWNPDRAFCQSEGSPWQQPLPGQPVRVFSTPDNDIGSGSVDNEQLDESFDSASFTATDGEPALYYCQIRNEFVGGNVVVNLSVVNDNGGTATPGEFTAEMFALSDTGTPLATELCDDLTGECVNTLLEVGDYVVGMVGPTGYTYSATQTVDELVREALADPDATFSLGEGDTVTIDVIANDPVPSTTTTTTTTMAPETTTTTVAATTTTAPAAITTTTAMDASGVTLPSTGTSDQSTALSLAALMLLLMGGAAVALARRER